MDPVMNEAHHFPKNVKIALLSLLMWSLLDDHDRKDIGLLDE